MAIGDVQAAFNEISLSPREEQVVRALNFMGLRGKLWVKTAA
jgi:hypothetical protein